MGFRSHPFAEVLNTAACKVEEVRVFHIEFGRVGHPVALGNVDPTVIIKIENQRRYAVTVILDPISVVGRLVVSFIIVSVGSARYVVVNHVVIVLGIRICICIDVGIVLVVGVGIGIGISVGIDFCPCLDICIGIYIGVNSCIGVGIGVGSYNIMCIRIGVGIGYERGQSIVNKNVY